MVQIRTYVGTDGKLHFVNSGGADTVLPFSPSGTKAITIMLLLGRSGNSTAYARVYVNGAVVIDEKRQTSEGNNTYSVTYNVKY